MRDKLQIPSLFLTTLLSPILMVTTGCRSGPPTDLIMRNDHRGLADWYQQEAVGLRGKADEMRRMVKQYEDPLFTPSPKQTKEELISHCELFIKYYAQAAEEADALAEIHRQEDKAIP